MAAPEIYRKFTLRTVDWEFSQLNYFKAALNLLWETPRQAVDWLDYEHFVRDVCESTLTVDEKVWLMAQAIGAYTGRGIPPGVEPPVECVPPAGTA